MSRTPQRARRVGLGVLGLWLLLLTGGQVLARRTATVDELGGRDRFLTAVSTDKPTYRPGERVYVRGVVLHAFARTPLQEQAQAVVTVRGPKGDRVAGGSVATQQSVWSFAWDVPAGQPGGEYTLAVTYPFHGHAPAERRFDVRAYRAPRLRSQIEFMRDGYGPGDTVTATLEVTRAEGGVPEGATVTAVARVDGAEVARVPGTVDAAGLCTVGFELPAEIKRGEGSLAFVIEDGGVVETATKTLPILLQTVDLQIFPEGGELVGGLPNRVYLQARTPARKPADISGIVVEGGSGRTVAEFATGHEGRGRFELRPVAGQSYRLRVLQPAGIKATYALPSVQAEGVVLRAARDTTGAAGAVELEVGARPARRRLRVTLRHRERLLADREVAPGEGLLRVALKAAPEAAGVLVATVWGADGAPLAERLVFRAPAAALDVELRPDRERYVPGERVRLTLRTTRNGQPVPAVVGLSVTDDTVLEMIEKREQAPRLPVMMLLEPEVRDLADAHVYLDSANPDAPLAVDLLLGTQGWRRFALQDLVSFVGEHGDPARRAVALRIRSEVEVVETATLKRSLRRSRGGGLARVAAALFGGDDGGGGEGLVVDKVVDVDAPRLAAEPAAAEQQRALVPVEVAGQRARGLGLAGERRELQDALRAADGVAKAGRLVADNMGEDEPSPMVYVRQYAHAERPDRKPTDRTDFTETLLWHAGVATDASTGEATVEFWLNDSVTTFRAFAEGFDHDGALGAQQATLESVQPFYVEPKLPLEVTAGDRIALPVSLVNALDSDLALASVTPRAVEGLTFGAIEPLHLGAGARVRRILDVGVGDVVGELSFALDASAGLHADRMQRTLRVVPRGFPNELSYGGLLGPGRSVEHGVVIPEELAPGSMKASVAVYPTPLANLTQALERLIQDPYGCFEQTSSTTYPLTMAQQYFTSHQGVDPDLVRRAKQKLEAGYQRLTGYECKSGGYEWFGADPGHETLTAYGVLQFTDMSQVREVDAAMLERTRTWLLGRRDGQGGFKRERRALHTWIEDRDCSDAYIAWALLEAGEDGLKAELVSLKERAPVSTNSYVWALAANALHLGGEQDAAEQLMGRLVKRQQSDGSVDGATTSIVGSGGNALVIEATALAVLAWLRAPAYAGAVERGMKYLASACESGRFGSTQSTVLALRAIVAYDRARARPKAAGSVQVLVDGAPVGAPVGFDPDTQGAIELPDISTLLSAGSHTISLRMKGGSEMPYSVGVTYNALTPVSSQRTQVSLQVRLAAAEVVEGEIVEAQVRVANTAAAALPTPVAIIGLPGGLEPRHDQLKELVNKGRIAAYEVLGRDVVLYWRGLGPGQTVELPLSLVAAVPGEYTGPASRAYLYYTDEDKVWLPGLQVRVRPKVL